MNNLYVRLNQRHATESFFRCGIRFTKTWAPVEVDDATKKRLEEEQMLDVSIERPADLGEDIPEQKPAAASAAPAEADTPPPPAIAPPASTAPTQKPATKPAAKKPGAKGQGSK